MQDIKTICEALGLETLGDLEQFYKNEAMEGETFPQTLQRYYNNFLKGE